MKVFLFCFLMICQAITVNARQTEYTSGTVNDSLKNNAHSVVHEYIANVTIHSSEEGEGKFRKVITILNEEGKSDADFVCFADKFRLLNGFKGELLDEAGKRVSAFKKSDLKTNNFSEDLASDDKLYIYDCTYEVYPYTIIYEWEMKYKHGFLAFPGFAPVTNFNQSLVSAQYQLSVPQDMKIDFRTSHTQKPDISRNGKVTTYQWEWPSVSAIERETLGPSLMQLTPSLYIKPLTFSYDKYQGKQSTWQELSAWQHSLLEGRDRLSQEQMEQIRLLVKDLDNDYDKVKKLYTYLGEKMRYVSIQLGIGGLQPMTASETMQMGFGDCKALSHLLKVMLQTVGIPSEYVVISTKNAKLYSDYPNVQQMNHVILKVPLKERTLWLECTNPFIPFGYIHQSIAGHEALVVHPERGRIECLPNYVDSLHTQNYNVEVKLSETSETVARVECVSKLSQYEANVSIIREKPAERKDRIRKRIQLNQVNVSDIEVVETEDSLTVLTERYTLQGMYGNKNGNRLFVPVNPFRKELFRLSNEERRYDIHISYGFSDNDTIKMIIPEGFRIETMPKDISMVAPFGHIRSKVEVVGNEIIVSQSLYVKKGIYPARQIVDFNTFNEAVKKAYNGKIILKK